MRSKAGASEAAVRAIAAAAWDHQEVVAGYLGGAYVVRVMATVPPVRGAVAVVRAGHAKAGVAWRMALVRLRRVARGIARSEALRADELEAEARRARGRAGALLAAVG